MKKLLLFALIFLCSVSMASAFFSPHGYYRFDTTDLGLDNEGLFNLSNNGCDRNTTLPLIGPSSADCERSNSDFLTNATVNLQGIRTIDGWWYLESVGAGFTLWNIGDVSDTENYLKIDTDPSGFLRLDVALGAGSTAGNSGSAITLNEWHHIVTTFNGSDWLVYQDGVFNFSVSDTSVPDSSNDQLNVMADRQNDDFGDGMVDNFALFNDSFSAANVTTSFNGGAGLGFGDPPPHGYDPLLYYECEDNFVNTGTQSGFDLTANGGVNFNQSIIGQGCRFNADNERVRNDTFLDISGVNTIEFWVNFTTLNNDQDVIEISDGSNDNRFRWDVDNQNSQHVVSMRTGGVQRWEAIVAQAFSTNTLYHFLIRQNDTNVGLFFDGALISSEVGEFWFNTSTFDDFMFGDSALTASRTVRGVMDNMALFNESYTTADIAFAFNNGAGRNYSIVAVPSLEFNTTVTLINSSSPQNEGTIGFYQFNITTNITDSTSNITFVQINTSNFSVSHAFAEGTWTITNTSNSVNYTGDVIIGNGDAEQLRLNLTAPMVTLDANQTFTIFTQSQDNINDTDTIVVTVLNVPSIVALSGYNLTSEAIGCTEWNNDPRENCNTTDTTPTITFNTNVSAFCRLGIDDFNHSSLNNTRDCSGGEGTTSHTCTLIALDALGLLNQTIYAGCTSEAGFDSGNSTSSSGALPLDIFSTPGIVNLTSPLNNSLFGKLDALISLLWTNTTNDDNRSLTFKVYVNNTLNDTVTGLSLSYNLTGDNRSYNWSVESFNGVFSGGNSTTFFFNQTIGPANLSFAFCGNQSGDFFPNITFFNGTDGTLSDPAAQPVNFTGNECYLNISDSSGSGGFINLSINQTNARYTVDCPPVLNLTTTAQQVGNITSNMPLLLNCSLAYLNVTADFPFAFDFIVGEIT